VSKRVRIVGLSILAMAAAQPAAAASARAPLAEPAQRVESVVERDGTLYVTLIGPKDFMRTAASTPASRGNAHHYAALIDEIASRYAVSAKLVEAVIRVESGFNPRAVSPRGALGLMQLMPATAAQLGVRDVFNERENVDSGVRHLRNLIDKYRDDLRLALAAYNAGAEAVARYGGIPPYAETQSYVRRVLNLFDGPDLRGARPSSNTVVGDARAYRRLDRHQAADGTVVFTNLPVEWLPHSTQQLLGRTRHRQF
jgi:soluble lytic murein transglycosylase-like protein